jgi:hypothetical protein
MVVTATLQTVPFNCKSKMAAEKRKCMYLCNCSSNSPYYVADFDIIMSRRPKGIKLRSIFGTLTYINQYGGRETGSSYNFGSAGDRNVISNGPTMFSRVVVTMKYRPLWNFIEFYVKYNMGTNKPEVVITMDQRQIEMWFQVLLPCFHGSPSQSNMDRHAISSISAWNLIWLPRNQPPNWNSRPPYWIYHRFRWSYCKVDIVLWRRSMETW